MVPRPPMWLRDAGWSRSPATGNYSYACDGARARTILVGDAYTFIDPVFSSGVLLAMTAGFPARTSSTRACARRAGEARARKRFEFVMRHGPKVFSWFIYRVTNPTLRELFMTPSEKFDMKKALLSVLAGDLFRDTSITKGLFVFRCVYYAFSVVKLRRTIGAWRRRAFNIRDESTMGAARG